MGSAERVSDPAVSALGVPGTSGYAEVPSNSAVRWKKCWKNPLRACGLLPRCFVSWGLSKIVLWCYRLVEGSFIRLSHVGVRWLCRGFGAADDPTHHVRGATADGKVRVCTQRLPPFDLPLAKPRAEIQKGKMFPKQNLPALLQKSWRHPEVHFGNHDAHEGTLQMSDAAGQNPAATSEKQGWILCSRIEPQLPWQAATPWEHLCWESGKLFMLVNGSSENSFR